MPKQVADLGEPLKLGHSAIGGLTAPQPVAHPEAEPVAQKPEPLRVIDPMAGAPKPLEAGTKIE